MSLCFIQCRVGTPLPVVLGAARPFWLSAFPMLGHLLWPSSYSLLFCLFAQVSAPNPRIETPPDRPPWIGPRGSDPLGSGPLGSAPFGSAQRVLCHSGPRPLWSSGALVLGRSNPRPLWSSGALVVGRGSGTLGHDSCARGFALYPRNNYTFIWLFFVHLFGIELHIYVSFIHSHPLVVH